MRALLVAVLLCASLGVQSQPQQKHGAAGAANRGGEDQQNDGRNILVIHQAQRPETRAEKPASKEQQQSGKTKPPISDPNLWIAIFTGVLMVVAIVQAIFFWRQLGFMREGAKDTKKAADAAAASADLARDAFIADHRPWVNIESVVPKGAIGMEGADDKGSGIYTLDISVKNVGTSPATCIWTECRMLGDRFPDEDTRKAIVEAMQKPTRSEGITLLPGETTLADGMCDSDDKKDPETTSNLGLMICCVFYAFPFDATKGGRFVSMYRVRKKSLDARDLKIELVPLFGHAE
jgi:hypothetical protein